jgi:hypothetical protein
VTACPPSPRYRLRKFVGWHRMALGIQIIFMLLRKLKEIMRKIEESTKTLIAISFLLVNRACLHSMH